MLFDKKKEKKKTRHKKQYCLKEKAFTVFYPNKLF